MAKGWKTIFTINGDSKAESNSDKRFNKTIRTIKTPSYDELKKESIEAFNKVEAEDASILAAFEEKRLKSKTLIKRAIELKKAAEKADKKKKEVVAAEV